MDKFHFLAQNFDELFPGSKSYIYFRYVGNISGSYMATDFCGYMALLMRRDLFK